MQKHKKPTSPAPPTPTAASPSPTADASSAAAAALPPVYYAALGEAALAASAPRLAAIADDDLASVRLDVEAAVLAALNVCAFIAEPATHARFLKQHEVGELDIRHVDGLKNACFAVLYALGEAKAAGALETDAAMPSALLAEATDVKSRMKALCEYHFADHDVHGPEVERLRHGASHRHIAGQLNGYARIYTLCKVDASTDKKNYKATDLSDAQRVAGTMLAHLSAGMSPKARKAFDTYVRAWTLMSLSYYEVRACGLYLLRHDKRADEKFPSLFVMGRPGAGRPKKKETEVVEEDTDEQAAEESDDADAGTDKAEPAAATGVCARCHQGDTGGGGPAVGRPGRAGAGQAAFRRSGDHAALPAAQV